MTMHCTVTSSSAEMEMGGRRDESRRASLVWVKTPPSVQTEGRVADEGAH